MVCSKCGYDPSYFAVCKEDFIEVNGKFYCLDCYEELYEQT